MKTINNTLLIMILLLAQPIKAETIFEVSSSVGERRLDIFRKEASSDSDNAKYVGFAIAAYRFSRERAAWGAVVETMLPLARENDVGSGRIFGVRPVNFLYRWDSRLQTELYFGAAQYDWINKSTGFYLGGNVRYSFRPHSPISVALDYRYFQDLAHDGGPGGDQIIDGPGLSLNVYYRF